MLRDEDKPVSFKNLFLVSDNQWVNQGTKFS
jgi:hypothetical protein